MQIEKGEVRREVNDECYNCYDWGGCPTIAKIKEKSKEDGKRIITLMTGCDKYKPKGIDF